MTIVTFSATRRADRETLGERVTSWIRQNSKRKIVGKAVRQSSDRTYHCMTITLFLAD